MPGHTKYGFCILVCTLTFIKFLWILSETSLLRLKPMPHTNETKRNERTNKKKKKRTNLKRTNRMNSEIIKIETVFGDCRHCIQYLTHSHSANASVLKFKGRIHVWAYPGAVWMRGCIHRRCLLLLYFFIFNISFVYIDRFIIIEIFYFVYSISNASVSSRWSSFCVCLLLLRIEHLSSICIRVKLSFLKLPELKWLAFCSSLEFLKNVNIKYTMLEIYLSIIRYRIMSMDKGARARSHMHAPSISICKSHCPDIEYFDKLRNVIKKFPRCDSENLILIMTGDRGPFPFRRMSI